MDVPIIGAHCSLSSCNLNDFLPIKCKCEQLFCKDHIIPEAHSCPQAVTAAVFTANEGASAKLERCALGQCKKPSLEAFLSAETRADPKGRSAALCGGCKKAFCAEHREPSSHSCVPVKVEDGASNTKNAKARALLNKHFPSAQTSTSSVTPSIKTSSEKTATPKKLTQLRQVQLMKMRHKARPGDPRDKPTSVAMDQRLHLLVSRENDTETTLFWFRKTSVTGKAVDLLANHFNMSSNSSPLHLLKISETGNVALSNSSSLGDHLEDGSNVLLSHINV